MYGRLQGSRPKVENVSKILQASKIVRHVLKLNGVAIVFFIAACDHSTCYPPKVCACVVNFTVA